MLRSFNHLELALKLKGLLLLKSVNTLKCLMSDGSRLCVNIGVTMFQNGPITAKSRKQI